MKKTDKYFKKNGLDWIEDAYNKTVTIAHNRQDVVLDLLTNLNPNSILDLGCGDGRFLNSLGSIKNRIGVDYSPSMLDAALNKENIRYESIDLNNKEDYIKFENFDKVDIVTMMGVIHYLEDPLSCVSALTKCANNETTLIISFRNKLYNVNPDSKYFSSDKNKANIAELKKEIKIWESSNLKKDNLLSVFEQDINGSELILNIKKQGSEVGVTDMHWNPALFEHWRQFTPLESILLLKKAGFTASGIIPIHNKSGNNERRSIRECTSFVIISKLKN